jgi:hypothetical protein
MSERGVRVLSLSGAFSVDDFSEAQVKVTLLATREHARLAG